MHQVLVALTPEEKLALERAAASNGFPDLSSYLRAIALTDIVGPSSNSLSLTKHANSHPGVAKATRILLLLAAAACLIAWLIILAEVESVVVTGPIILLLGVAILICAAFRRHVPGIAIGCSHIGICILFVSLVNLLNWGPRHARAPFIVMGAVYVLAILPLTYLAYRRIQVARPFGTCQRCGYMLYGLSEPRCPECGLPFDPALLITLAAPSAHGPDRC